ncbi:hypothetical protein RB195_012141 [Necator americanus]|uniref:Uncharacterized protein n=1 Tax=Necator americanus TaxID=51031 RepID=A0ABR1D6I3_NECAM
MFAYPPAYPLGTLCLGGIRRESAGTLFTVPQSAQMSMEETLRNLEQLRKTTDSLAENADGSDQNMRLARRPDIPPVGRPQASTPIRKLQKA